MITCISLFEGEECGLKSLSSFARAFEPAVAEPVAAARGKAAGSANSTSVSFIDVGKGDCILVQAGGLAILIDAGYEETSGGVLSHLRHRGVDRLECLIITHYDRDHVGGVRDVGNALEVGMVYLPGYEGSDNNYRRLMAAVEDLGLDARPVTEELRMALGDATLSVFPSKVAYVPGKKGEEGNDNDVSLVASLIYGDDSYLFTGDLEKEGIEAFLEGRHGSFDVLKMPHHGQKSSLTDELVDDVRPKIAIITDSEDDPADKKTLKLLEEAGVDVYRTSTSGTIVVQSDGTARYVKEDGGA